MLMFLSIVFWVSLGLLLPAAIVLLVRAILGRRMQTDVFCKRCRYNRTGIDAHADCPECGCPRSDERGRSNTARTRRARSRRRIVVLAVLCVLAGGLAVGSRWLHDECKDLPTTFNDALDGGHHAKVELLVRWFPELAEGRFRFTSHTAYPPLFAAAGRDDQKMIGLLLDAGADPDGDLAYPWRRPLFAAAVIQGNRDTTRQLLEAGANPDINLKIQGGASLLSGTCMHNRPDLVALLLEFGANPDHMTRDGTALDIAAHYGSRNDAAAALLEGGADPNLDVAFGTPLHIAARRTRHRLIEILLEHDADINQTSTFQLGFDATPLDHALDTHRRRNTAQTQAVIDLLRAHGGMTRAELDALDPESPTEASDAQEE